MSEPTPGSFHGGVDSEITEEQQRAVERIRKLNTTEVKLEASEGLVGDLTAFVEEFMPTTDLVYYPCCGPDISPSRVFGSNVLYLDYSKKNVDALQASGFKAVEADANEYNPGPVDVLLIFNPQVKPFSLLRSVKEDGYVVCNDYHSTATDISKVKDFEFVGALTDDDKIDHQNLEAYWQQVETDEELDAANPTAARHIRDDVKKVTGQAEHILESYRKILAESPDGRMMPDGGFVALWAIPKKKQGTSYIFKRKTEEAR